VALAQAALEAAIDSATRTTLSTLPLHPTPPPSPSSSPPSPSQALALALSPTTPKAALAAAARSIAALLSPTLAYAVVGAGPHSQALLRRLNKERTAALLSPQKQPLPRVRNALARLLPLLHDLVTLDRNCTAAVAEAELGRLAVELEGAAARAGKCRRGGVRWQRKGAAASSSSGGSSPGNSSGGSASCSSGSEGGSSSSNSSNGSAAHSPALTPITVARPSLLHLPLALFPASAADLCHVLRQLEAARVVTLASCLGAVRDRPAAQGTCRGGCQAAPVALDPEEHGWGQGGLLMGAAVARALAPELSASLPSIHLPSCFDTGSMDLPSTGSFHRAVRAQPPPPPAHAHAWSQLLGWARQPLSPADQRTALTWATCLCCQWALHSPHHPHRRQQQQQQQRPAPAPPPCARPRCGCRCRCSWASGSVTARLTRGAR
jgi:uncharacterized membrane protein YgcG